MLKGNSRKNICFTIFDENMQIRQTLTKNRLKPLIQIKTDLTGMVIEWMDSPTNHGRMAAVTEIEIGSKWFFTHLL